MLAACCPGNAVKGQVLLLSTKIGADVDLVHKPVRPWFTCRSGYAPKDIQLFGLGNLARAGGRPRSLPRLVAPDVSPAIRVCRCCAGQTYSASLRKIVSREKLEMLGTTTSHEVGLWQTTSCPRCVQPVFASYSRHATKVLGCQLLKPSRLAAQLCSQRWSAPLRWAPAPHSSFVRMMTKQADIIERMVEDPASRARWITERAKTRDGLPPVQDRPVDPGGLPG